MRRFLLLEGGFSFEGKGFGASVEAKGEVIFTTAFSGFYEAMTDPSYAGQIMTFAFPSMFYYEFSRDIRQSGRIQAEGIVARDTHTPSGIGFESIHNEMKRNGVPGIYGIDTRKLVKIIRDQGTVRGIITENPVSDPEFVARSTYDRIRKSSTENSYILNQGMERKILYVDLGSKVSLLQRISTMGETHVINLDSTVRNLDQYDMMFLSNGPGNPSDACLGKVKDLVRRAEGKIPVTGVCLGHQIICEALGAEAQPMRFGHHGINHSVTDGRRVFITSHNHNYHIPEESLKGTGLTRLQWDMNDGACEMVADPERQIISVQYHPEGSPGPVDPAKFFNQLERMVNYEKI